MTGWRADVETVYAATDVMVISSDNEGMPVRSSRRRRSVSAAVTTDVGSAGEVVVDGVSGIVTEVDTTALAGAVHKLMIDPLRRQRFGDAAASHARDHFSADRLAADHDLLYTQLAARFRAARR